MKIKLHLDISEVIFVNCATGNRATLVMYISSYLTV
jgi:hypothetical protein